jgi:hypothetical protein
MLASRVLVDPISGASSHVLTGQSEKRVSITFFPPPTGRATLNNETPVVAGSGIVLTPGNTPIMLNVHEHGDTVQREWYVIYDGTTSAMTWIEALATCEPDQKRHFGATLWQRSQIYNPPLDPIGNYATG